jgi:alkanesulfonate monooxygenase SsuD/methylene tetrahydromethanopterin reductase-like flavin-dependent oxidoreductase (luciferase family)
MAPRDSVVLIDTTQHSPPGLGLRFDLRSHPDGASHAELYDAALAACEWGERHFGPVSVTLTEHHGSDEGHLPSPLIAAAAVAGRTRRAHIMVVAVILPLRDVLQLAEDVAVLDLVSGGRVDVVYGAGYRYEEFAMFGVDIRRRGELMEESVQALTRAWTGEPFEYRGRTVRVTPRPRRRPRPPLLLGGSSAAAARRAARHADLFVPTDQAVMGAYLEELERLGKPATPYDITVGRPPMVNLVHPDPEAAWALVGHHCLHDMTTYARWLQAGRGGSGPYVPVADLDELRASGLYNIVTPEECAALVAEHGMLDMHPLVGGLPPEVAAASFDLIEREVLPAVAEAADAGTGAGAG